ncbi:hypothetical protein CBM2618_A160181 [Cupriavidus taiwanensis]|nr:hypothetical protein CBM2622_A150179 [Cupriavidus taiwanensis]SOZ78128.1 hypothetical protein CBM2618_A160181 [Cupriavidus taiwanensis]
MVPGERAKKESAARTLNFSDLKCPEGRCTVTAMRVTRHSGKRRAMPQHEIADEKKARRSGLIIS